MSLQNFHPKLAKPRKRLELALIEDVLVERLATPIYVNEVDTAALAKEIMDTLIERGYLNED